MQFQDDVVLLQKMLQKKRLGTNSSLRALGDNPRPWDVKKCSSRIHKSGEIILRAQLNLNKCKTDGNSTREHTHIFGESRLCILQGKLLCAFGPGGNVSDKRTQ